MSLCKLGCLFGIHNYEVYKEIELCDYRNNTIGLVIISKCKDCGKIHETKIYNTITIVNMHLANKCSGSLGEVFGFGFGFVLTINVGVC